MNFKKYTVSWDNYDYPLELNISVDLDIVTDKTLHEINQFFCHHEDRLRNANGNVLHAVLKMLAATCFQLQSEHGYNTGGLISLFDHTSGNGVEGWPPMDGSEGFLITHCDVLNFDFDEMTVEELPGEGANEHDNDAR